MRRILLKLSGEALAGEKKTGFDEATVRKVALQVKQLADDGLQIGRHITPQLTTVERDPKMLGQKAVEKLIDLIEKPKTTLVEQIVIAGKVYPGGTVSDLNHSK